VDVWFRELTDSKLVISLRTRHLLRCREPSFTMKSPSILFCGHKVWIVYTALSLLPPTLLLSLLGVFFQHILMHTQIPSSLRRLSFPCRERPGRRHPGIRGSRRPPLLYWWHHARLLYPKLRASPTFPSTVYFPSPSPLQTDPRATPVSATFSRQFSAVSFLSV